MSVIFITNDDFNYGLKWEVVIGTEKHHCKSEEEVIQLIKRALDHNEETFSQDIEDLAAEDDKIIGKRPLDPESSDEEIFTQEGDW